MNGCSAFLEKASERYEETHSTMLPIKLRLRHDNQSRKEGINGGFHTTKSEAKRDAVKPSNQRINSFIYNKHNGT